MGWFAQMLTDFWFFLGLETKNDACEENLTVFKVSFGSICARHSLHKQHPLEIMPKRE